MLLDHTLTYDRNGNLEGITDSVAGNLESRSLTYDVHDRLTAVSTASDPETYAYDPLDNVRQAVVNGVDRRFHYLPNQRLEKITTATGTLLTSYSRNARGELAGRSEKVAGTPPVVPPTIFRNGFEPNVTTVSELFGFDQAQRLVSVGNGVVHTYDAHNHRVSTMFPGGGTRIQVYSRGGELLYTDDGVVRERSEYLHLNGTLVAQRTLNTLTSVSTSSALHSDHRGTPSVKTAFPSGLVDYRSRLMPYGSPYDGIWRDGPGFTKHATDEAGHLSYMQQRYYDPVAMRFLSPDPVGVSANSFNRYWYANNNPYTFVDPDGRCPAQTGTRICIHAKAFDSSRSSGKTFEGSSEMDAAVTDQMGAVRTRSGTREEVLGSLNRKSDGTLQVERIRNATTGQRDTADTASGNPPLSSEAIVHGHTSRSVADDASSRGDADPVLAVERPNYAVSQDRRVIVHEVIDGRYQVRMVTGAMTNAEIKHFKNVVESRQESFYDQ